MREMIDLSELAKRLLKGETSLLVENAAGCVVVNPGYNDTFMEIAVSDSDCTGSLLLSRAEAKALHHYLGALLARHPVEPATLPRLHRADDWTDEAHAACDKREAAWKRAYLDERGGDDAAVMADFRAAEEEFGRAMLALDRKRRPEAYTKDD